MAQIPLLFAAGLSSHAFAQNPGAVTPEPYRAGATYALGESVAINDWLTLTVVYAGQKLTDALLPRFATADRFIVLELQFLVDAEDQPGFWFFLSDNPERSDIALRAGQIRVAPSGLVLVTDSTTPTRALGLRDLPRVVAGEHTGSHYALVMPRKGLFIHALRFDVPVDRRVPDSELAVAFEILTATGKNRYPLGVALP